MSDYQETYEEYMERKDRYEFDKQEYLLKIQDERINQLESALRDMSDSLGFYAGRFSWEWSSHPNLENYSGEIRNDSSLVKYMEADGEEYQNHCGGKRAREALSRNKEILDTINKRGEE